MVSANQNGSDKEKIINEMRAMTGSDVDFAKKWAPDELKFITEDPEEKAKLIKRLYKERFSKILLKKSPFPNRPMTYHFKYPQTVIDLYTQINQSPQKKPKINELENEIKPKVEAQYDRIGIELYLPDDSDLVKFGVADYLHHYSVPLAKIARVYSTMKELMKSNGFILSKAQKYNVCWGFSKHRAQIKACSLCYLVLDSASTILALPGLLAAWPKRLLVAKCSEEEVEVPTSLEFYATYLLPEE